MTQIGCGPSFQTCNFLSSDSRLDLDSDIMEEEEVRHTILNLPNGKTPGPDGYSTEYYKLL